jgi:hypothetical protein
LRRRLAGANGVKLWRELDRVLPLGCAVQAGNLVMPSLLAHDFGDADPFGLLLVTGARVAMRAGPNAAALPLRLLSWTMVTPVSGDDSATPLPPRAARPADRLRRSRQAAQPSGLPLAGLAN